MVKNERRNWLLRVGIIVFAALMVEIISIVQFRRFQRFMEEEMGVRARIVLSSLSDKIGHVLSLTESTMRENRSYLSQSLEHPDSTFNALKYLIDDNPRVVGGCLSFVPYYYPSKGRLFEPYASKDENGRIVVRQIAGEDHDYTQNVFFQEALENEQADWSDPYLYGDPPRSLTTYSYPLRDSKGRIAAICGLDMDLSWVGDTLNANHHFASTFTLLLTQDGKLVAGPPSDKVPSQVVDEALSLARMGEHESDDGGLFLTYRKMPRDPYWQIVQIYRSDELFATKRRIRLNHILFITLAFGILLFIVSLFARNERNLRDATAEQARMSGELSVARRIQEEMLPKAFPSDVYGILEPAREVGGDLFDFYRRDGKLFFCIGDVSGKGAPAAMLMSVVHSLFRMVSQREESPSRILHALNGELCRGNDANMFVTFFVGCLDLYTGKLHFGNAGHDKPFLLAQSASLLPVKANLPLGVFPDTVFEDQALVLAPGSTLFLYTDGLTEAKRADRAAFGLERVREVLARRLGAASPESLVKALGESVHAFVGDAPQSDDLTMLAIRYAPGDLILRDITLSNDPAEVERLSVFFKDFSSLLNLDGKISAGLRLALEEAVVNVINYAYPAGERGNVTIYANSDRREVRFAIVDEGVPFDPTAALSADTTLDAQQRPIGGLGILLTRKLTDSVSYCRKDGKNVLTLTKSIV